MSPNEKKKLPKARLTQISAMVDPFDAQKLVRLAEVNERTFAAEVRMAIRFYLEHGQ